MNTSLLEGLNTSMVGTVVEFFPETQTATMKLHMQSFGKTMHRDYHMDELPELYDVPIHFVQSNGFVLTTPVFPGDDGLIFFAQKGIDHWLYRGLSAYEVEGGRPEAASRTDFDLSSALCVIGLNNMMTNIANFNMEGMELRNKEGDQRIALQLDKTIGITTPENVVVTCKDIDITSTGDLKFKSEGNVTIESGGTLTFKAKDIAMVKG